MINADLFTSCIMLFVLWGLFIQADWFEQSKFFNEFGDISVEKRDASLLSLPKKTRVR